MKVGTIRAFQQKRTVRPLLLVAFGALLMAGLPACGTRVHFVQAFGPKVRPLPNAAYCPHPVPKALGYINLPIQVTPEANGDFLVADGGNFNRSGSKVVEFNPQGRAIWAYVNPQLDFVHSAYPTTRGNILISDTNNNRVIEVTRQCKIVYNSDDHYGGHGFLGRGRLSDGAQLIYPNDAKEIPNGHYLISSRGTSTVYEINRDNHVYWKCHSFTNLDGKPDHLQGQHNPQRLTNGDTLISDSDNARVVMVNPSCTREVWQYPPINHTRNAHGGEKLLWPRDATLMANHDILIDDSLHNRCLEVNSRHIIIRKYYDLPQPYSCWPLPGGGVVSGDGNTHGIAIWQPGIPQAGLMALIPPRPIFPNGKHHPFKKTVPKHLLNGGFEPEANGNPIGWQMDDVTNETLPPDVRASMIIDKTVAHGGYSSGRIQWLRKTPHAPIWWGQAIRVKQYRWIKVGAWILTHDITRCTHCDFGLGTDRGDAAYLAVQFVRATPYASPVFPSFPKIRGTTILKGKTCTGVTSKATSFTAVQPNCWMHVSQTFYIPQGVQLMSIQCVLSGHGTAWFDDVTARVTPRRLPPGE